jgi:hypothetical protein
MIRDCNIDHTRFVRAGNAMLRDGLGNTVSIARHDGVSTAGAQHVIRECRLLQVRLGAPDEFRAEIEQAATAVTCRYLATMIGPSEGVTARPSGIIRPLSSRTRRCPSDRTRS